MKPLVTLARELAEAREKAMPLPWTHRKGRPNVIQGFDDKVPPHIVRMYQDEQARRCTQFIADVHNDKEENAALIVAAVNAIPALVECVAELERLAEELEAYSPIVSTPLSEAQQGIAARLRQVLGGTSDE